MQAESGTWLAERRKLLTASSFHAVCTRRQSTPCGPLVKRLLYNIASLNVPSLKHGRANEKAAILCSEKQENIKIEANGLFIDEQFQFLGKNINN